VPKGPDQRRHRDSQVSIAFRTVERKEHVDGILRAHDYGLFQGSASLVDEMMTDDRIQAVTEKRSDSLLSCDIEFEAADDSDKAREVRDLIGGTNDAHGLWRRIAPPADMKQLLQWGWFLRFAVAELVWTYDKTLDLQMPRIVWWHPAHARWDWEKRRFLLRTDGFQDVVLPDLAENSHGDGKWFQWLPDGGQYGWRRGLVRSLAHKYIVRQWNDVDWARFNERHGLPVGKAKVPTLAGREEDEAKFFNQVSNLGSETSLLLPQGEGPGQSYDFEWAELQGRNWETFQALKKDLGDEIAIALLGQNLTTQVDGGSFAAAKAHEGVELRLLARDAEISHAIYDQVLSWFCLHNFGDAALAPRMVIKVVPEEDEAAEVAKDEGVGRVVLGCQMAGIQLDERAYAEKHGLPLLAEEEAEDVEFEEVPGDEPKLLGPAEDEAPDLELTPSTLGAIITVNEARNVKGLAPLVTPAGDIDPDGGLTIAEFEAKRASIIAQAENAKEGSTADPAALEPEQQERVAAKVSMVMLSVIGARPSVAEARLALRARSALGLARKRYAFAGLPIAIEHPVGSTRTWKDDEGQQHEKVMRFDYGYIEGHLSGDDEELDVYIGPDEEASRVYVVHQLKAPDFKKWDEDKILIGFESESDARRAYLLHRSDGDRAIGGMTSMPLDVFKRKLKRRSGTGKIRASVATCDHDHAPRAALKAKGKRKPKASLQDPAMLWNDSLETRGKTALAKAIKGDLAIIQRTIAKSKDFAEVKAKLTTLFAKTLKPDDLATLVERANVLAQLNGRLGAAEDL
jgi:phage gp29-like protein